MDMANYEQPQLATKGRELISNARSRNPNIKKDSLQNRALALAIMIKERSNLIVILSISGSLGETNTRKNNTEKNP